ncbi:mechanosensitive ion channel family protein [Roseivirga sp.]|uniref:mechanosensitive ion channel family protein n=1 Tax=Roseivirga sp. TaxID=1964215 RepID=UPI003B8DC6D3
MVIKYVILSVFLFFQDVTPQAQDSISATDSITIKTEIIKAQTSKYVIDGDSIMYIYAGIGPYSIAQRGEKIKGRVSELKSGFFGSEPLRIENTDSSNEIFCGNGLIMTIYDVDANALGLSRNDAAEYYLDLIQEIRNTKDKPVVKLQSLLINIGIALVIVILFIVGLKYYNRLFRLLYLKIRAQKGKMLKGFKLKTYEVLTEDKQILAVTYIAKGVRIGVLIFIIYLLLPVLFSLFPWTQGIATTLFGYILDPLKNMGNKFVAYIPDLLTIGVILVVTKYILRVLTFFKDEVAKGKLEFPGFYKEWAKPTYNIIKTLIIALSFIAIWPSLPMSDSEIFKGVSTFIGLLVALGGAGAISNVIAGLVITYMRSFKIGDRVKIGEVMGDVKEKSLLNTRIKTIKNEIITIPNSHMLNSHTINYTTANDEEGLILHTTITLGYDVPWRTVHEVLIEAALNTEHIKKLPKPYVLQTSLDDFYVSYQLNARTREIHKMALIYSKLHQNIQDKCNEAGIEILSPHYGAQRDGNHSTIPQEHLPENYQAPWFRLKKDF